MTVAMIAPLLTPEFAVEDLGVCYITAVLRENGYDVKLTSVIGGSEDYSEILEFKPEIIGITVYNQTVELVYKICQDLKKVLPDAYICIGGYAPTYHAMEMLIDEPSIDFAIRGEGELAFLELANNLSEGKDIWEIQGLAYRDAEKNRIILNERHQYVENLDELPFPSRDLLLKNNWNITLISSTRGCMRNCFFCCGNDFWKKGDHYHWRAESVKRAVDEIESLHKELGRSQFWIVDATFEDPGFNEERMTEFAKEIIKRGLVISYFVFCRAGFYKKASDELMKLLIESGMCEVYVGTEAANNYDLKVLGKGISVEDNIRSLEFFGKYDIYPEIGFINFNPYSTFEGLRENADFLEKYQYARFFRHFSSVNLYKGSILYEKVKKDGLLKEGAKFYEDFGYRYQDKRIEKLVCFLNEYIGSLQQESNFFNEYVVFERYYSDKLSHLKRFFKLSGTSAMNLLKEHQKNLDDILVGMNIKVSLWNRALIDLAEANWDYYAAKTISKEYVSAEYMAETLAKIRMERIRFGKNLAKIDTKLLSLIRVT
ncbi:MAG TPA: radical SAM protein [Pseudobacteroides sp.]|uniref:B12-binding domain-containing radical SAM protein n=1 Tax=Pseudobacteroides sp. TaxID=1968840 RepID=UPI002F929F60